MKFSLLIILFLASNLLSASRINFSTSTESGSWLSFELEQRLLTQKNNSRCIIQVTATGDINGKNLSCISVKEHKLSGFISSAFNLGKCTIEGIEEASRYISKQKLLCNDRNYRIEYGKLVHAQKINL